MKLLFAGLFAACLCACAAPGTDTAIPRDECLAIGVEMAESAKALRSASFTPSPEAVDMLMEQAADFEQCMADTGRTS